MPIHPLASDMGERRLRVSPSAVETNGIGKASDYHLNRTRTMAEGWLMIATATAPSRPPAVMGRPAGPREPTTIGYAGREKPTVPASKFLRLKASDGRWLHMSGEGLTLVKADSWIGTAEQLFKLRERRPELNRMTVCAP